MEAYEVREGQKGLEEARDALKTAMREAREAGAAWPMRFLADGGFNIYTIGM